MYLPNGLSHGYDIGPQLCGLFYPSPTRPLRLRYSGSRGCRHVPFLATLAASDAVLPAEHFHGRIECVLLLLQL